MNFKKIIIFLIILIFLTLTTVSAYQDADNNLTAIDEEIVDEAQNDIIKVDDKESDVEVEIYKSVNVDEPYSSIVSVYDGNNLNGNVVSTIDGKVVYNKTFTKSDEEMFCFLSIDDLKNIPSFGTHKVNVTYLKKNANKPFTLEKNVDFTYTFRIDIDGESADEFYEEYGSKINLNIWLPDHTKGSLALNFNGKTYKLNVKNGRAELKLSLKNLKIDTYILKANFIDSSKKYPTKTIKIPITVCPAINCHELLAFGEKDTILITSPKGTHVNVDIYEYDNGDWGKKLASFSGNSQLFNIPLKKLKLSESKQFFVNCTVGDVKCYKQFSINFCKNYKGFKSNINKVGDSVKIKLTGPRALHFVEIYLDNVLVKSISLKKGKISHVLSDLPVGKHKINVKFMGKVFYSKTYFVNVKAKDKVSLSLKTIKVKKSAKKIVLNAILKINKKPKKGLKVTFKFNGKKYTKKTNSKGVAKLNINKKALNNLKVGKKVKYNVKYSFKTVEKTAKVKR